MEKKKIEKTEKLREASGETIMDILNSKYSYSLQKISEKKRKNTKREGGFKGFGIS